MSYTPYTMSELSNTADYINQLNTNTPYTLSPDPCNNISSPHPAQQPFQLDRIYKLNKLHINHITPSHGVSSSNSSACVDQTDGTVQYITLSPIGDSDSPLLARRRSYSSQSTVHNPQSICWN